MLTVACTFNADLSSPARVRHFVRRALTGELPTDRLQTAVLLTSELATNAVLHARTDFDVGLCVTKSTVRIAVSDRSSRPPTPIVVDGDATSGRGLRLLDLLASRWGTEMTPTGKSVWFEIPLAAGIVISLAEIRALRA